MFRFFSYTALLISLSRFGDSVFVWDHFLLYKQHILVSVNGQSVINLRHDNFAKKTLNYRKHIRSLVELNMKQVFTLRILDINQISPLALS